MDWTQIETGSKNVATMEYKGRTIRVVTGYEIGSDKWPVHIYVSSKGREVKHDGCFPRADSMEEGFEAGFAEGKRAIDAGDFS